MSIAITLSDAVDIETYDGLIAFLTDHLELSDATAAQLPNLIRMAEYRLNRLLVTTERETSVELVTATGEAFVTLPQGHVATKQVKILGDEETGYPLDHVSLNVVETYDFAGRPLVWTVYGTNLYLGPIPDSAYTLELRYHEKLDFLSDGNQTNWLLTDHADSYIYMCASTISLHHGDKEMAALYFDVANGVVDEINRQGLRKRNVGTMRMRGLAGV